MKEELIRLLEEHVPFDATEAAHREKALVFLRGTEHVTSPETLEGHVTASAMILSPDLDAILLTHHKKLQRWLCLGGHIENDATLFDAALREAREESGIKNFDLLQNKLFDVDVHTIPAHGNTPEHLHYNLRILLRAATRDTQVSEESTHLKWFSVPDALKLKGTDSGMRRMLLKVRALLAEKSIR